MKTRNAVIGLLGLGMLLAMPATAKADFGFSFRYGGGYCGPRYYAAPAYYSNCAPAYYSNCAPVYRDCGPVVVRSYPRYYARPYYGGRYYGRSVRVYR